MEKVIVKTVIENYDRIETTVKEHKGTAIVTTLAVGASFLGYKYFKNWCKSHFRQKEETHKSNKRREEETHNFNLRDQEAERKSQRNMNEMWFKFVLKTQYHDYIRNNKSNESEKRKKAEEEEIKRVAEAEPIESFNETLSKPSEEEKNLVGPIFPSGGISLLAGEKGLGKTSLITQALFQLSGSKEYNLFPETKTDNIQQVVYFDYELTRDQFKNRYKNIQSKDIKFIWDSVRENSSSYLIKRINKILSEKTEHTTIVIDNLTKIKDLNSPQSCRNFYTELENIRAEYKTKHNIVVSFIIVAHVNIKRPIYKSVDLEDIQTSSRFINFADSVIVIGRTRFKETILLKVCKNRNGKESNGSAYVFKREEEGLLHYEYQGEFSESDVLPQKNGMLDCISTLKKYNQVNNNDTEYKTEAKRGRKPQLSKEDVIQMLCLRSQGMSKNAVSRKYGLTRQAYNKAVNRYELVDNYN